MLSRVSGRFPNYALLTLALAAPLAMFAAGAQADVTISSPSFQEKYFFSADSITKLAELPEFTIQYSDFAQWQRESSQVHDVAAFQDSSGSWPDSQ